MEKYQMNRPGCRPYNSTCGMTKPQRTPAGMGMADRVAEPCSRPINRDCNCGTPASKDCSCGTPASKDCSCRMPGTCSPDAEMYAHLQHLPAAMAYVPCQEFTTTFDLCYALNVGTIFPQLCKPFCGKRGGCR